MTGGQLRAWMDNQGWSIRSLAAELGVDFRTVQRWRSSESPVPRHVELALRELGHRNDDSLEGLDAAVRELSDRACRSEIGLLDEVIMHINHGTAMVSGGQNDRGLNMLVTVLLCRVFTSLWRARQDAVNGYPGQAMAACRTAFEAWLTTRWVENHPRTVNRWLWASLGVDEPQRRPPTFGSMMADLGEIEAAMKVVYGLLSEFAHPRGRGLRWHLDFDGETTTFRYGAYFDESDLLTALWLLIQVGQASFERIAQLQLRALGSVDDEWLAAARTISERAGRFVDQFGRELMVEPEETEG